MMKQLEIKISGKTESDLTLALDEVRRKVEEGFLSAFDGNDSGNYTYEITEVKKLAAGISSSSRRQKKRICIGLSMLLMLALRVL